MLSHHLAASIYSQHMLPVFSMAAFLLVMDFIAVCAHWSHVSILWLKATQIDIDTHNHTS